MPERQRAAVQCHLPNWPRQLGIAFGLPKTNMVLGKNAANAYFCRHERKKLLIGKFAHVTWNYRFDSWFLQWHGRRIK
jgi:hypothetical protein